MITVPEALELFDSNTYKQESLTEMGTDDVAVYKTYTFVYLCRVIPSSTRTVSSSGGSQMSVGKIHLEWGRDQVAFGGS